MELWVHHLCMFAGCLPGVEANADDRSETLATVIAEREAALEDA